MNEELLAFLNPMRAELAAMPIAHAGPNAIAPPEPETNRGILYGIAQDEFGMSPKAAENFVNNVGLETFNKFVPVKEMGNRKYENGKTPSGRGLLQFTGTDTRKLIEKEKTLHNAHLDSLFQAKKITQQEYESRKIPYDFRTSDFLTVDENLAAIPLFLRGKARELKLATPDESGKYNTAIWDNSENWRRAMNSAEKNRDMKIMEKRMMILPQISAQTKHSWVDVNGKKVLLPQWRIETDKFKKDMQHYKEHKKKK